MKNLSKQAVILDNLSSPYIDQAIIILKSNPIGQQDKIIEEAERIVASYFNNKISDSSHPPQKNNTSLKATIILLSAALICTLIFSVLK